MRPSATITDTTSVNKNFSIADRQRKSSRRSNPKSGAKPSPSDAESTAPPIRPLVVSVNTAIDLLDDNRDGIYELLRQKKLLSYLDGRRRKIFMSSIDELIRERRQAALAEPFERHRYPTKGARNDQLATDW